MIIIFERAKVSLREFVWRPGFFKGHWDGKITWRFWWGMWSVSYYPVVSLRGFFEYIESGRATWVRNDK